MAKSLKINIFALPSQTAVLFWLVTAVLLGAMMIGLSGTASIPMWLFAVAMFFLPVREFLLHPDRDIRQYELEMAGQRFPSLREAIRLRADQIGLKRIPQLLISQTRDETYEMGSFRRWYIIMSVKNAQTFEDFLNDPQKFNLADVQIFHELYHFKTGDYWQLGYLTELFKVSFNLMLWVFFFLIGWGFLLILAKDAILQFSPDSLLNSLSSDIRPLLAQTLPSIFPSAAEIENLRIKAQGINLAFVLNFIANITIPYIILTGILWLFYRPLLWRMREFYADAGVVQEQGSTSYFWDFVVEFTQTPSAQIISVENKNVFQNLLTYLQKIRQGVFWPSFGQRLEAIEIPEHVFYNWKKIAWILGSLTLLLEIFLATPISLPVVGNSPMMFTTLGVITAVIYFLLPQLVMKKSAWKDGLRILFVIFLIRSVWLLFTLTLMWGLYFIQPEFLSSVLQSAISSVARYAGTDPIGVDLLGFLVESSVINLLQIPIIFVVQIISVTGLLFLIKRTLQWRSFINNSQRFKRVVFSLTFGVLFVLLTLIMPISMAILKGDFSAFIGASGIFAILGMLMLVGGGVWLFIQDQSYYQSERILHSWLWVEYEDE